MLCKLFISVFVMATVVMAQDDEQLGSAECLYCRRMDKNSGFLVSYSYCQQQDECLKDAWNYINRDCQSGW